VAWAWALIRRRDIGTLLAFVLLALLLHALALLWLARLLQPPSLLAAMPPPFYTRTIAPTAPVQVAAAPERAQPVRPKRPSARIRQARKAIKNKATADQAQAEVGSAPEQPQPPASAAQAASAPEADEPTQAQAEAAAPPDDTPAVPQAAASAPAGGADTEFLSTWPADTRLSYKLTGNYRGDLYGKAHVLWQRDGTRYQAVVDMSAGLLASLNFSSQGEITAAGLRPQVYEETTRKRRRGVRLGEDVQLNNGTRVPRPDDLQDTASQFAEIGHRFATGQAQLAPGAEIRFSLARPGGIDDWSYDVIGQEAVYLPRLGEVATWHVKPRRIGKPSPPLTMEMWFAPSMQYLPVRIRITQDADTYIDLLVDTIEQR